MLLDDLATALQAATVALEAAGHAAVAAQENTLGLRIISITRELQEREAEIREMASATRYAITLERVSGWSGPEHVDNVMEILETEGLEPEDGDYKDLDDSNEVTVLVTFVGHPSRETIEQALRKPDFFLVRSIVPYKE